MAEADNQTGDQSANQSTKEDPIKNVKAEFDRKLENITQTINAQWQDMQAVLASLNRPATQQAPPEAKKPLKDLIYEDDAAFDQALESRIASTVENRLKSQNDQSAQLNRVVADLSVKFPEFNQTNTEAYQLALKKHTTLPKHLQGTADGVRIAMLETVADLGLVPSEKRERTTNADDFNLSGKGAAKKAGKKGAEVDEATLMWSEAFGVNTKDEKVQERLKKYSARDWQRYK